MEQQLEGAMTKLSDEQATAWAMAVGSSPADAQLLVPWLTRCVSSFFPFRAVLLAFGEELAGEIRVTHLVAHGHQDAYLNQLSTNFDLRIRGCLAWWLKHRQPFCVDVDAPPSFATAFELEEIQAFHLGHIAAHGVLDPSGRAGSYISFSGLPERPDEWHLEALRLLVPTIHEVFVRHIADPCSANPQLACLSDRQRDIVRLAGKGLSSKMIARELAISEKTVRNQLTVIYDVLGVRGARELLSLLR